MLSSYHRHYVYDSKLPEKKEKPSLYIGYNGYIGYIYIGESFTMIKWDLPRDTRMIQHIESINGKHHITRMKDKNHMIMSTDAEKAINKTYSFMIKVLTELGIEGVFFSLTKDIYNKPIANIKLNGKELRSFPLDQKQNRDSYSHHFYFNSTRSPSQRDKARKKK